MNKPNSGEINMDEINDSDNENKKNVSHSDLYYKSPIHAKELMIEKKKEKNYLLKHQRLEYIKQNSSYIHSSKIHLPCYSIIPNISSSSSSSNHNIR